jgi:hypothetical protein
MVRLASSGGNVFAPDDYCKNSWKAKCRIYKDCVLRAVTFSGGRFTQRQRETDDKVTLIDSATGDFQSGGLAIRWSRTDPHV